MILEPEPCLEPLWLWLGFCPGDGGSWVPAPPTHTLSTLVSSPEALPRRPPLQTTRAPLFTSWGKDRGDWTWLDSGPRSSSAFPPTPGTFEMAQSQCWQHGLCQSELPEAPPCSTRLLARVCFPLCWVPWQQLGTLRCLTQFEQVEQVVHWGWAIPQPYHSDTSCEQ